MATRQDYQLSEKARLSIIEYIATIDPITKKGNVRAVSRLPDTLSESALQKLTNRADFLELCERVQVKLYLDSIKTSDFGKSDLERSLEINTYGYAELINPFTGTLKLIELKPADILKAKLLLADLRGWKGTKQVNVLHDITGFLNKVSNRQFKLPCAVVSTDPIESINVLIDD